MMDTRLRREKENRGHVKLTQCCKLVILVMIVAIVIGISYFISILPSNIIYSEINANKKFHFIAEKLIPQNLNFKYGDSVINNKKLIIESDMYSMGQASYTESPNAEIEFNFNGTSVEWVGFKGSHNGRANIFLNGDFIKTVDLYSAKVKHQETLYKSGTLSDNKHVLVITALKETNENSRGNVIGVDHFNQWNNEGDMKQIDDNHPSIYYINSNQLFYLQFIIRKLLHITVYFMITSLLIAGIILSNVKLKWVIVTPFISLGIALVDEYRQLLVVDRDGSMTDVMIDCVGILLSISLFSVLLLIKKLINKYRTG